MKSGKIRRKKHRNGSKDKHSDYLQLEMTDQTLPKTGSEDRFLG